MNNPLKIYLSFQMLLLPFCRVIIADLCSERAASGLYKVTCFSDTTDALFNNFDDKYNRRETPLSGALKNYFFAFNDYPCGGNSSIVDGVTRYEGTGMYDPQFIPNSGKTDSSYALSLDIEIGNSLPVSNSNCVHKSGFAGFGFGVYDSSSSSYWDEKGTLFPGFYFDYLCSGDLSGFKVEILDYYDVSDAKEPNRKPVRGPGVVWSMNLPPTGSAWKYAYIHFDSLTIDTSKGNSAPLPLDRSRLARFSFYGYGKKGATGRIAIDNIYFGRGRKESSVSVNVSNKNLNIKDQTTAIYKDGVIY